ncbi:hypothetical protein BU16DRAFT_589531 [Lophium mytilinum]|uniref:Secreted protein n=1 Tax=Lophium mytilinum TaxID=390894 RepID=A0A6A6QRG0_9PEZI|nr:hypothetical protein BU16DRAFT_589531 [Lophium mytilinum]
MTSVIMASALVVPALVAPGNRHTGLSSRAGAWAWHPRGVSASRGVYVCSRHAGLISEVGCGGNERTTQPSPSTPRTPSWGCISAGSSPVSRAELARSWLVAWRLPQPLAQDLIPKPAVPQKTYVNEPPAWSRFFDSALQRKHRRQNTLSRRNLLQILRR